MTETDADKHASVIAYLRAQRVDLAEEAQCSVPVEPEGLTALETISFLLNDAARTKAAAHMRHDPTLRPAPVSRGWRDGAGALREWEGMRVEAVESGAAAG